MIVVTSLAEQILKTSKLDCFEMDYKPLDCNIVVVSPQKMTWTTKDLRPNFHPGGLIVCHFVHLFFVILWTSH